MPSYKLQGIIKHIGPAMAVGANNFMKQEFSVLTQEQYPQTICLEVQGNNVGKLLERFGEGEEVELDFNLTGREWINPEGNSVYFKTLVCWKIKHVSEITTNSQEAQYNHGTVNQTQQNQTKSSVPFGSTENAFGPKYDDGGGYGDYINAADNQHNEPDDLPF